MITPSVLADRLRVRVLLRNPWVQAAVPLKATAKALHHVPESLASVGLDLCLALVTCIGCGPMEPHGRAGWSVTVCSERVPLPLLPQINGSLARAAIKDLAEKGHIRVVSKTGHQEIWTRATNTDAA